MLVNWKVQYCNKKPSDKQPPDYFVYGDDYWFFRYFENKPVVDIVDISSCSWLENIEKNKIRFYIWQTLRIIPKLTEYDLIVSHGMQSGVVVAFLRRMFKTRAKHVVFDIGSFASASESGFALKLMQFASKSIDGVIYHTSKQIDYYKKCFPWIVKNSRFIRFGTDLDFFSPDNLKDSSDKNKYILCAGYAKRDWNTLIKAYNKLVNKPTLKMIGFVDEKYRNVEGLQQIPFIPVKELINEIYNAKFCILPLKSFNYSFGQMTLMQQMALKKCVIASNVPSLRDYIIDKKTAFLFEPEDEYSLKGIIEQLLQDECRVAEIGENALRFLENNCNEKIMAHEIEVFFKEVLYG